MPFQRNQKHGYRRSRSRSPYRRNQSFRRSRSPRQIPKRSVPFSSRDLDRRMRDRRTDSPPRRSPVPRVPSKSRDSRHGFVSPPENKDSGRYMRQQSPIESRLQKRGSSSRSPLRDSEIRSAHMDRVNTETKMETRIVRKKMTLTDRFGVNEPKFELEENITIGLQRNPNIPISTVVNVENKDFDFNKFSLKRRDDEGSKPIFDREEIKAFRHDENLDDQEEFERRVITVMPSKDSSRSSRGFRSEAMDVDLSIRKSLSTSMSYDNRHWVKNTRDSQHGSNRRERDNRTSYKGEKLQITRWRTPSPRKEPQIRLDPRPDPRYEAKYRANREREEGSSHKKMERIEHISQNPNDLRHSLLHRRISNPAEDARYRIEAKRHDHDHKHDKHDKPGKGRDAWEVASEQEKGKGQSSVRQRRYSDDLRSILPDFSKRENRFDYEEWKDKPEMVPKGLGYYEHDNRGEDNGLFQRRTRGRPFSSSFRSRPDTRRYPTSRGGYRPKPYSQTQYSRERSYSRSSGQDRDSYRSRGRSSEYSRGLGSRSRGSSDRGEWKHDMFDKLEKEDDNCPTSTT